MDRPFKHRHNAIDFCSIYKTRIVLIPFAISESSDIRDEFHVRYQGNEVVMGLPENEVLEGSIPPGKLKLVAAWIELHREESMANWELASQGEAVFPIDPLR